MIAPLRPYPEYKESGVSWTKKIPRHWEIVRNGRLFSQRNQTGRPELPILEVSIHGGVAVRDLGAGIRKQALTRREGYKCAAKGDIAYNTMRMWQGAVGAASIDGLVSPAYVVARPRSDVESRYFAYLFRTPAYMDEVNGYSRGIVSDRNRLYWEDFEQISATVPPLSEQRVIADYLDAHGAWTRRVIRAKGRLIELLNEQKQAIIHRAVTRGLDSNVRLQTCGSSYFGSIPEHWELAKLGRHMDLITGFPFPSSGFSHDPDDMRLLRGINVSVGQVRWESVVRWQGTETHQYHQFALQADDIVLGLDRPVVRGGIRAAVIQERDVPSLLLQRVARIRPLERVDTRYLFLLLGGQGFSAYLSGLFTGISVPHISPEQVRAFRFPLPPLKEQRAIVEWVAIRTEAIEEALSRTRREVDLVREYRARLISDAVTGGFDIRGVKLPRSGSIDRPDEVDSDYDAEPDYVADAEESGDADD